MQINLLVDSIFASAIVGAVSYLYYADRINQLPLAMIGIAIGIALLPAMSKKLKDNKFDEAIKLQNIALEIGLILVIPASLALTCLSEPIIITLFERGQFNHQESIAVAKALKYYSFGLPSYVLVKIMEPAFFSRGNTKTPMMIAIVCLFSNAILNGVFYLQNIGYVGIILASIISSYLNLLLLISLSIKKKYFYFENNFFVKILKILTPAFCMAILLIYLKKYFELHNDLNIAFELLFTIIFGLLSYLAISYFTGSLNILLNSNLFKKIKTS